MVWCSITMIGAHLISQEMLGCFISGKSCYATVQSFVWSICWVGPLPSKTGTCTWRFMVSRDPPSKKYIYKSWRWRETAQIICLYSGLSKSWELIGKMIYSFLWMQPVFKPFTISTIDQCFGRTLFAYGTQMLHVWNIYLYIFHDFKL